MIKTYIINFLITIGISSPKSAFIGGIIGMILIRIFNNVIDDMWDICKKTEIGKDFSWIPNSPMKNTEANKLIQSYPKDIKWDIDNNRLSMEELVEGSEAFTQHLVKFLHTEKGKYLIYPKDYGNEHAETIFIEKNLDEFKRQCSYMAETIIEHEHFKDYIQELYSIRRRRGDLYIEFKVNGRPDTLICKIPCSEHIGRRKKSKKMFLRRGREGK